MAYRNDRYKLVVRDMIIGGSSNTCNHGASHNTVSRSTRTRVARINEYGRICQVCIFSSAYTFGFLSLVCTLPISALLLLLIVLHDTPVILALESDSLWPWERSIRHLSPLTTVLCSLLDPLSPSDSSDPRTSRLTELEKTIPELELLHRFEPGTHGHGHRHTDRGIETLSRNHPAAWLSARKLAVSPPIRDSTSQDISQGSNLSTLARLIENYTDVCTERCKDSELDRVHFVTAPRTLPGNLKTLKRN